MKKTQKYIAFLLCLVIMSSCKKEYLETLPTEEVAEETVFSTTKGAQVALDGTYRNMYLSLENHANFGHKSYELVSDLMGNDMVIHAQGYGWFNTDYNYTAVPLATSLSRSGLIWRYYYTLINNANRIMDNLPAAAGTDAEREKIRGQALAIRAHSYFYLINFFQHTYKGNETKPGVPLYIAGTSEGKPRGTVQEVYTQIVADLKEAEVLLTGKARTHISHINAATAQGILARVALQMEDYPTAVEYAKKARGTIAPMAAALYADGFSSRTNPEWMWGLEVNVEQATIYASYYSHVDNTAGGYAGLGSYKKITRELFDQIQTGDVRKTVFRNDGATTGIPQLGILKFRKPSASTWNGDYLMMRAGEMYLIEAEASARTGNDANARTVLNALVTTRSPLYNATQSGTALINEILLQRRIELYGEGFSLFDIKRLKTGLNRPTGPGNHGTPNFDPTVVTLPDQAPIFLMRIPQDEINNNSSLNAGDQNP